MMGGVDDDLEFDCPICFCFMTEPTQFPAECKHIFCRCCIATLVKKANSSDANLRCPMCRRPALLKTNETFKIEIDLEYQERLKARYP